MFNYLKQVIADGSSGTPSSKRWVLVVSTISLCAGFLMSVGGLLLGNEVSDAVVLGLAGILATLSGGSYAYTKAKELEANKDNVQ